MSQESSSSVTGAGPAPTPVEKREMRSRAQKLKARLVVGRKGISESLLAEIRGELQRHELVKVCLEEDEADDADALAALLSEQIPCRLIQRIGRVALLYRKRSET